MSDYLKSVKTALESCRTWHFFALAFALRLAVFAYTFIHPELRSFADSNHYYLLGLNLLEHGSFTMFQEEGFLESIRLPGYPVMMVYIGELISYEVFMLLQCLVSAVKVFFVIAIAAHLGLSSFWRAIAAMLVVFNPTDIFLSAMFLSETFFTFFLYLGVVLILRSHQKWSWLLAGLAIGITALTRGQGLWVFTVLMALVVIVNWKKSAWFAFGFLVLVGPWIWRNYQMFDRWFYSDSATVVTLFYTLPEVKEKSGKVSANAQFTEYVNWNYQYDWSDPQQINQYMKNARKEIKSVVADNPGTTVLVVAKKFFYNLLSPARGLARHFFGDTLLYWLSIFLSAGISVLLALGLIAGSIHLFSGTSPLHWVLWALVVVIVGSSAFSAVDGRFRSPADLSLVLLFCFSLQQFVSKWRMGMSLGTEANP